MQKWIYDPCQVTSSYRKVGFLLDDDEVPEAIVRNEASLTSAEISKRI